jgi:hypothetical protein
MTLTAAELFSPAPSGVGPFGNVPQIPPSGTWLSQMLAVATQVQLPTTSWQSGAPERTIFATEAVMFSLSDANIGVIAQAGFLQTAANGSVTVTLVDGTTVTIPVTPDPSNAAQNPTGAPGWLDLLGQSVYATQRLASTFASGPLAIAKTTAGSIGPFPAGGYHTASLAGATYSNVEALTIPSSIIAGTGGVVTGVTPGFLSTIITTQSAHGLAVGASVYVLIPTTSGITGLAGVFALVTGVTSTTFSIAVGSSGTWTASGNVYLCTIANMQADVAGPGSNAGPNQVTTTVTQNTGVFVANITSWVGSNWESNNAYVSRSLLSLASRSPNGPSQSYVYYAETAQQILAAQTPPYVLTNGPVSANEFATPLTGVVYVYVASASPVSTTLGANVTPGAAQLGIDAITNASPAVVSCVASTSLAPGQSMAVTITGVLGMSGVTGTFLATYVSGTSFSIPVDTTLLGTYTGGGSVEGGDLGAIDQLIQQNCVPDGQIAVTASALAFPITPVATVLVPQAYVQTYQLAVIAQLQAQLDAYAIGGDAPSFAVQYDDMISAIEEAGVLVLGQPSYVRQVQSLTLNGGTVDVPFPAPEYKALLANPVITVIGV